MSQGAMIGAIVGSIGGAVVLLGLVYYILKNKKATGAPMPLASADEHKDHDDHDDGYVVDADSNASSKFVNDERNHADDGDFNAVSTL